jgi:hypothetical protein
METVIALVLIVMVGMLLLLGLIGVAIGAGYVNLTTAWIIQDAEPETIEQVHQLGERTRRALDTETRRYLDELYESDLAAIEAAYKSPAEDDPEKIVQMRNFRSSREKGTTL